MFAVSSVPTRWLRPFLASLALLCSGAASIAAQQPAKPDSARKDTAVVLPTITVRRSPEDVVRVPAAVGVLTKSDVQRGQPTLNLGESMQNMPGVFVANRYNFSQDDRLSIRAAGSRSNFGVRGIKILLDGVPQTLPDGQSQLTNVDYSDIGRIEVLRGASSSLYGNSSGGVVAFSSEAAAPEPFYERLRLQGSAWGGFKWQSLTTARLGRASGTLSISRFTTDGFRVNSAADIRNLNLGIDYGFSSAWQGSLRLALNDTPKAQNPGALTPAEWNGGVGDTAAAPTAISRGTNKDVAQQQLSLQARSLNAAGTNDFSFVAFGILRQLKNPLATPAPGPQPPGNTAGIYVDLDREVGGFRVADTYHFGTSAKAVRLTAGADAQWQGDARKNYRAIRGVPTDTLLLDQQENVRELAPFAQVNWAPIERLQLSGGLRYDWVTFTVHDNFLSDGADNSGSRTLDAPSGNVGASYTFNRFVVPYASFSTAFETPTTTELGNRPDATGGFNDSLGPQRIYNYEIGARGTPSPVWDYQLAFYLDNINDALVQWFADDGRAYFRNAGKVKNKGVEANLTVTPMSLFDVFASYTYSNYKFSDYEVVNAQTGDTTSFTGNRLPGVPVSFLRIGFRLHAGFGFDVAIDQTVSSSVYADDANTQKVDGWATTNLRLNWAGNVGKTGLRLLPYVGINNLFDANYVGAVTVNAAFNRYIEPAPGINAYAGMEVGWASR